MGQSFIVLAHQSGLGQQTQCETPGGQSQYVPSLQSMAVLTLLFHVREAGAVFLFAIMFHVRGIAGQSLAFGAQLMVSGQQTMSSGWPLGEVQQVPSSHTLPMQRPTPALDLDKDFINGFTTNQLNVAKNKGLAQAELYTWFRDPVKIPGPGKLNWIVGDPLEDVGLVALTRCEGAVQPVRAADAALTYDSCVIKALNTRNMSLFTRGTRAARAVSTRDSVTGSVLVIATSFNKCHDNKTKDEPY